MASYTEIQRVSLDGPTPVRLILQKRHEVPPEDFHCLSWRTNLPSGKKSRRFYSDKLYGTGFWTIPVADALCLLDRAEAAGMLDRGYDDPQRRHGGPEDRWIDSRELTGRGRALAFAEIFCPEREGTNWGPDPVVIYCETPDGSWRKILIVDCERRICTFRSTTTDASNPMGMYIGDRDFSPWRIGNAMPDVGSRPLRRFRDALRSLE